MMIGNELIRELVETVIITGKLKDASPLSLLLIAAPESGKTRVVLEKRCKNVKAFADITGKGILNVMKSQKELTHIVINDMVAVLSHRQSVNKYTIAILNAMTEEGITSLASPAGIEDFDDGKRGVIASITTEMSMDSRFWWNKIGFASRMIPFCYKYPEPLLITIKDSIDNSMRMVYRKPKNNDQEFVIPKNSKTVAYSDEFIRRVRRVAEVRCQITKDQGMRRLHQYHTLIRGHALLRNRTEPVVEDVDLQFLEEIDLYCSYDSPKELKYDHAKARTDAENGLPTLHKAQGMGVQDVPSSQVGNVPTSRPEHGEVN
jgi:hypothetical protein